MGKNRLEAFSDGVIAIIITIMVLELKAPHGTDWASIKPLLPSFISYVMSFLFVGVYWGNHHHLLHLVKHFSSGIMLANLNLLFWLSLVPFATSWMGENHFASTTVTIYALLLNLCGISYTILQRTIAACNADNKELKIIMKKQTRKGLLSVLLYTSAIPLSYINPYLAVAMFTFVAIMWLVPDKNIERQLMNGAD
jgi:uncharacterized membrane protein